MYSLLETLDKMNVCAEVMNPQRIKCNVCNEEKYLYKWNAIVYFEDRKTIFPFMSNTLNVMNTDDILYGVFYTLKEYEFWLDKDDWRKTYGLTDQAEEQVKAMQTAMKSLFEEKYNELIRLEIE